MIHGLFVFLLLFLCACSDVPDPLTTLPAKSVKGYESNELDKLVSTVREKYGLPALGVLIAQGGNTPLVAMNGARILDGNQVVSESDMWFLGSTAKAMTATLIATFVNSGELTFESTLFEIFPEYAASFTDETRLITVEHLLSHSAGLKPNPANDVEEMERIFGQSKDVVEQRKLVLKKAILEKLQFLPGSDTSYSNTGYILAGAVIDRVGGEDYEALLVQKVFKPLNISRFGFGQPGTHLNTPDQPWGHRSTFFGLEPVAPDDAQYINPPLFNPAGNLYLSLRDWAKFVQDALSGSRGKGTLFDQALYMRLQTPADKKSGYAMGWGALLESGMPIMLTHNGSDGNWFAEVRAYPYSNLILLVVTNDGREDDDAKAAAADIRRDFMQHYSPYPPE